MPQSKGKETKTSEKDMGAVKAKHNEGDFVTSL